MLEQLAIWVGRHFNVKGTGRLLSVLYPCSPHAHRYVRGVRARGDGLLMELDSRNWIDWNLLFRGDYERDLTQLLYRLVPKGGVAVDIGANIGAHTLTLAQTVGGEGHVSAFEPNPLVRMVLDRNVALNRMQNVRVFGCALGDTDGILPLRVPKMGSAEYSNMGLASLVALETPHDLLEVEISTLDKIFTKSGLNRLDVVKIDVQGYEYPVLNGMREVCDCYSPAVIFEYEAWAWAKANVSLGDSVALLEDRGYRLWWLGGCSTSISPMYDLQRLPDQVELVAIKEGDPRLRLLNVEALAVTR